MRRRQTRPEQWLIVTELLDRRQWEVIRRLPQGSGILVLGSIDEADHRRLRNVATLRGHALVLEARDRTVRVHNARELTRALIRRPCFVLLSPIYETSSHPRWRPLPRMRAAALARLCGRDAVGLGGMNAKRYARVAAIGFTGWAGISAFRT